MEEQKINALWTHLHWLSVLAQQGSYTAAAARLGVSKAAMSQRIAELERAAKVTLVQRTTRSLRLTEAGRRIEDKARGIADCVADAGGLGRAELDDLLAQMKTLRDRLDAGTATSS